LRSANHPATGAVSVTLMGARFSAASHTTSFRHSGYRASAGEATGWVADSAVRARSAAANSITRRVSLTAGERMSSVTEVMSFDFPLQIRPERGWSGSVFPDVGTVVAGLAGAIAETAGTVQTLYSVPMRNHPATGSTKMTVFGAAFGLACYSEKSRIGVCVCVVCVWCVCVCVCVCVCICVSMSISLRPHYV